ncbi:MAG: PepSY domain-containing protein, partial [Oxalobacteraceae bacterium]
MMQTLTRSMSFLHTWAGLLFGWLLFGVFLTGSISVFWREISHWATPELHSQPLVSRDFALNRSFELLHQKAPDAVMWQISLPSGREHALQLSWEGPGKERSSLEIEPISGVEIRETEGGRHFNRFHHRLGLDG